MTKSKRVRTTSNEKFRYCFRGKQKNIKNPKVLVFMSFSVQESTWIALSKEVEEVGGIFVLQGLPNDSYKELTTKIHRLRKKGVGAIIQIHPQLFQNYQVMQVPTFVLVDNKGSDFIATKVSGNFSVLVALSKIDESLKSKLCKDLMAKLQSDAG